mmetsp:Transcript_10048/g.37474  ORF Transcript_10048/g.37474 Transcript_10048/m.37474 type:complete len:100 (+) Transcript_10048:95-394(+)
MRSLDEKIFLDFEWIRNRHHHRILLPSCIQRDVLSSFLRESKGMHHFLSSNFQLELVVLRSKVSLPPLKMQQTKLVIGSIRENFVDAWGHPRLDFSIIQ